MTFLNESDVRRIEEAVRKVETKTTGELVTVIASKSDAYDFIPYLWAALIALFGASIAFLAFPDLDTKTLLISQIICFLVLLYVLGFPVFRNRLIPKSVGRLRASRLAREQFFTQNVHETEERCGILIFVSVAEHYVEIIADKGISEHVDQSHWQHIVNQFVIEVKARRTAEGFVSAIEACGDILATNFPVGTDNKNQLPNRLIIF